MNEQKTFAPTGVQTFGNPGSSRTGGSPAVGTAWTELLGKNPGRFRAVVNNTLGSVNLYVALSPSSPQGTTQADVIPPGGTADYLGPDPIWVAAASGTTDVRFLEETL